mgnify:CR=1 FL=1
MNKKKIILIAIIAIIVIAIIIGAIVLVNNQTKNNQGETTQISKLYEQISNVKEMTFSQTIDNNNKIVTAIKNNNGYKEVTANGKTRKYIVKDNNTYYLDETEKIYYTYQNNDTILTEIKEKFETLKDVTQISKGKERINGKSYKYEEIPNCQDFLFNNELSVNNLEYAKTRLYFDNDNLVYIKTIVGDNEEIIKIDISYNVNNDYFNIPKDYSDGSQV